MHHFERFNAMAQVSGARNTPTAGAQLMSNACAAAYHLCNPSVLVDGTMFAVHRLMSAVASPSTGYSLSVPQAASSFQLKTFRHRRAFTTISPGYLPARDTNYLVGDDAVVTDLFKYWNRYEASASQQAPRLEERPHPRHELHRPLDRQRVPATRHNHQLALGIFAR